MNVKIPYIENTLKTNSRVSSVTVDATSKKLLLSCPERFNSSTLRLHMNKNMTEGGKVQQKRNKHVPVVCFIRIYFMYHRSNRLIF